MILTLGLESTNTHEQSSKIPSDGQDTRDASTAEEDDRKWDPWNLPLTDFSVFMKIQSFPAICANKEVGHAGFKKKFSRQMLNRRTVPDEVLQRRHKANLWFLL